MSDAIIKVSNLGKRYIINHKGGRPEGLRHAIHEMATAPLRWLRQRGKPNGERASAQSPGESLSSTEEFWALKDVSFEVKRGEVVGIIGRNGAGKSTLLKILSRITEPTTGRVELNGRVASLLEVGTGFHPELTGRENIFLNGAILGMSRAEIRKKFDEIVAFAEVEKFLDTPVKRYSSGMYVRLAFSVAAHLEPEILIIDEVLAVGDIAFQKKCLGKMDDVSRNGRTVIFVSHNMGAIKRLCGTAVYLQSGRLHSTGSVETVIDVYMRALASSDPDQKKRRTGNGKLSFTSFRLLDDHGREQSVLEVGGSFQVEITVLAHAEVHATEIAMEIRTALNEPIAHINNADGDLHFGTIRAGEALQLRVSVGPCFLTVGTYSIRLWAGNYPEVYEEIQDALVFDMVPSPMMKRLPHHTSRIFISSVWDVDKKTLGRENSMMSNAIS